jgi:hypothetical protein
MVPYRLEWRVFDEEYLIAGTIDMVYQKKVTSYICWLKRGEKSGWREGVQTAQLWLGHQVNCHI